MRGTYRVSVAEDLAITNVHVDIPVRDLQSVHDLTNIDVGHSRLRISVRVLADIIAVYMLGHMDLQERPSHVMGIGADESGGERRVSGKVGAGMWWAERKRLSRRRCERRRSENECGSRPGVANKRHRERRLDVE